MHYYKSIVSSCNINDYQLLWTFNLKPLHSTVNLILSPRSYRDSRSFAVPPSLLKSIQARSITSSYPSTFNLLYSTQFKACCYDHSFILPVLLSDLYLTSFQVIYHTGTCHTIFKPSFIQLLGHLASDQQLI